MELTRSQARRLRLRSLRLSGPPPGSVAETVEWFGAMQAQDETSGLWSLGVRQPGLTQADVREALARGEAVRTWPMRGTLHLVPPNDVGWMLDLMAPRALARTARRHEQLGLDEATLHHGVDTLGDALRGRRLTRDECLAELQEAGISTDGQRGYHLLAYAAMAGVIAVVAGAGRAQTFVRLDEWARRPRRLDREEACATIAERFIRSHGPVRVSDLAGWTGLTLTDARAGVASAGDALSAVTVDGEPMVVAARALEEEVPTGDTWVALPGYDEYLLGYKDRTLMLTEEQMHAVVPGRNGVFQATVVHEGRVVALWKRSRRATSEHVAVTPLVDLGSAQRRQAARAFDAYERYLGMPVVVSGL